MHSGKDLDLTTLKRKEYVMKRVELHKKGLSKRKEFSLNDALNMLQGQMDLIDAVSQVVDICVGIFELDVLF